MQNIKIGIVKHTYHFTQLTEDDVESGILDDIQEDEMFSFYKGDRVKILTEIEDRTYGSGLAYVILNEHNESVTMDSTLIEIIK